MRDSSKPSVIIVGHNEVNGSCKGNHLPTLFRRPPLAVAIVSLMFLCGQLIPIFVFCRYSLIYRQELRGWAPFFFYCLAITKFLFVYEQSIVDDVLLVHLDELPSGNSLSISSAGTYSVNHHQFLISIHYVKQTKALLLLLFLVNI